MAVFFAILPGGRFGAKPQVHAAMKKRSIHAKIEM